MKRKNINIVYFTEVRDIVQGNVNSWKELNKDERTLYHFMGNSIFSVKRDIQREGLEVLDRFHIDTLPTYEPNYIYSIGAPIQPLETSKLVIDKTFMKAQTFEDMFADRFNHFQEKWSYATDVDIDIFSADAKDNILVYSTADGGTGKYDLLDSEYIEQNEADYKTTNINEIIEYRARYVLIPGAVDIVSITDHNGNNISYNRVDSINVENYLSAYDVNGNGIIDEDDVLEFENAIGITYESVNVEVWNERYAAMDVNRDGKISDKEAAIARSLLWSTKSVGAILYFDEIHPIQNIRYRYISDTPIGHVYRNSAGEISLYRNNTLGSPILHDNIKNNPGAKGIQYTSVGTIVEIDEYNNINFVRVDGFNTFKDRFGYTDSDKYVPKIIYMYDDILYILADNGLTSRMYFADCANYAVEYTSSYIEFDKLYVDPRFMFFNNYSRTFSIGHFDNEKIYIDVYDVQNRLYYIDIASSLLYVSHDGDVLYDNVGLDLYPIKIQNSIDDYAYNWGFERLPGEPNIDFIDRIRDLWKHMHGNHKQGILYGIARDIGLFNRIEDFNIDTNLIASIDDYLSGALPFRILVYDNVMNTTDLFLFNKVKSESDTALNYNIVATDLQKCTDTFVFVEIPDGLGNSDTTHSFDIMTDFIFPLNNDGPDETGYTSYSLDYPSFSETDNIVIDNGLLDFSGCNDFLNYISDMDCRVFIYYDALDLDNNIHYGNYQEIQKPYSRNYDYERTLPIQIDNLLLNGDYRNEKINNLENREKLVRELKDLDSSKWGDTTGDISYFNTMSVGGDMLKKTIWSGSTAMVVTDVE